MPPCRFRSRRLTFEQADYQCRTTLGRPALHFFWPLLACHLPPRSSRRPCTIGGSILKGSRIDEPTTSCAFYAPPELLFLVRKASLPGRKAAGPDDQFP